MGASLECGEQDGNRVSSYYIITVYAGVAGFQDLQGLESRCPIRGYIGKSVADFEPRGGTGHPTRR
jgi:hypothetical protein